MSLKLSAVPADNLSDNYGFEGETADAGIEAIRKRQVMNFLLTLLVSRGVPMLLGGDEFRRTQHGNNNAWCQDNDISWFDWTCLERHREIRQFVRGLVAFRRAHPALSKESFYTGTDIQWLSKAGAKPNWFDPKEKTVACMIRETEQDSLLMMFNADVDRVDFDLPQPPRGFTWCLAVDTSGSSPHNLFTAGEEPVVDHSTPWSLRPRASAIFVTRKTERNADH